MADGDLGPEGGGGSGLGGRERVEDADCKQLGVWLAVDDCPHVAVFLVNESSCRHRVHLHAGRYLLNIRYHVVEVQLQRVSGVLQQIAAHLHRHHLRCGKHPVELGEVGGGRREGEGGRCEVGALKGNAGVDELAAVGAEG